MVPQKIKGSSRFLLLQKQQRSAYAHRVAVQHGLGRIGEYLLAPRRVAQLGKDLVIIDVESEFARGKPHSFVEKSRRVIIG